VLVPDAAREEVAVREALGPGGLPHTDKPVLVGVDHLALLAMRFGVGDGGLEETLPGNPAIGASPVIVPVCRVWQEPGYESPALFVKSLFPNHYSGYIDGVTIDIDYIK